jgi:hypothetical protein
MDAVNACLIFWGSVNDKLLLYLREQIMFKVHRVLLGQAKGKTDA